MLAAVIIIVPTYVLVILHFPTVIPIYFFYVLPSSIVMFRTVPVADFSNFVTVRLNICFSSYNSICSFIEGEKYLSRLQN